MCNETWYIEYKKKSMPGLKKNIICKMHSANKYYVLENRYFNIFSAGATKREAVQNMYDLIIEKKDFYFSAFSNEFSFDAEMMKLKFKEYFEG